MKKINSRILNKKFEQGKESEKRKDKNKDVLGDQKWWSYRKS